VSEALRFDPLKAAPAASPLRALAKRPRLFASKAAAATGQASTPLLDAATARATAVLCVVDALGVVRAITPNAARVLGEASERAAELELTAAELLQADQTFEIQSAFDDLARTEQGTVHTWVFRTRSPRSTLRWLEVVGTNYLFDPQIAGLHLQIRDVTSSYSDEQRNALCGFALEHSPDAVLITNAQGIIEYVNPAFEKLTGYNLFELRGRTPAILSSELQSPEIFERLLTTLGAGKVFRGQITNRGKSGDTYHQDLEVQPVVAENGAVTHYVAVGRDITMLKQEEAQIVSDAYYDPLTGAATLKLLRESAQQVLALARRHGHSAALMQIDMNGLREINSTMGRAAGDALIREFAERLRRGLRESDTVARTSAGEFLILLSDVKDENAAALVVRRLKESMTRPFQMETRAVTVDSSIGIALYPQDATTFKQLVEFAGLAMERAHTSGTGYEFYRRTLTDLTLERISLQDDLRWAWERRQFVLHYQPVIELASRRMAGAEALTRGNVLGDEVLGRWPEKLKNEIAPIQFIPHAERTGRIVALDRWAIATAARQAASWTGDGWKGWISVNLSARSLHDAELPAYVARCLKQYDLENGRLVLEVTESAAMSDPDLTAAILAELKLAGALIALDDFGVGHSSLAYLTCFPVDLVKLDRVFVNGIGHDKKQERLLTSMITLAHRIGAAVVAEGVEEEEQLVWLRRSKCDYVQGFYVGRPQSPERVLARIKG